MRVRVCFRIVNYAGMISTTLVVLLVLRNAAVQHDAHLASICRRAETAGFGYLTLWPEYPQIASGTLDRIL